MSIEDNEEFIKILTRLNPKVSDMESVGHSTVQGLTSADIAACCAGCDDIGLMALKRRINDDRSQDEGFHRLYAKVITLAIKKNWKGRNDAIKKGTIRRFLDTCLNDYYIDHKCKRCKGTGKTEVLKGGIVTRTCQACDGKRFRKRNNSERAKEMKVDRMEYSRHWKDRHSVVMDYLHNIMPNREANAREKLRDNLKKGHVTERIILPLSNKSIK